MGFLNVVHWCAGILSYNSNNDFVVGYCIVTLPFLEFNILIILLINIYIYIFIILYLTLIIKIL
jgi:hypothetical protein